MAAPTLAQLQAMVRRDIRDPDGVTFEDATVTDFINAAIAEVSRICPRQARQDIAIVANTLDYPTLMQEVHRVEAWNTAANPDAFVAFIPGNADNDTNSSIAGWELWAGNLSVPLWFFGSLTPGTHSLRVWGWREYSQMDDPTDVAEFTDIDIQWAVREYATVRAFEYLLSDRSLFEQWATQANNTDITPASLTNMLASWQSKWERRRQQLHVIRTLQ